MESSCLCKSWEISFSQLESWPDILSYRSTAAAGRGIVYIDVCRLRTAGVRSGSPWICSALCIVTMYLDSKLLAFLWSSQYLCSCETKYKQHPSRFKHTTAKWITLISWRKHLREVGRNTWFLAPSTHAATGESRLSPLFSPQGPLSHQRLSSFQYKLKKPFFIDPWLASRILPSLRFLPFTSH